MLEWRIALTGSSNWWYIQLLLFSLFFFSSVIWILEFSLFPCLSSHFNNSCCYSSCYFGQWMLLQYNTFIFGSCLAFWHNLIFQAHFEPFPTLESTISPRAYPCVLSVGNLVRARVWLLRVSRQWSKLINVFSKSLWVHTDIFKSILTLHYFSLISLFYKYLFSLSPKKFVLYPTI